MFILHNMITFKVMGLNFIWGE